MEATLNALGQILLKAMPTFVLVFLLYFYLKRMFFRPLEGVLRKRYEATEGARKLADESLAKAAAKAEEFEAAMRAARGEVYQEIGQLRKQSRRNAPLPSRRRASKPKRRSPRPKFNSPGKSNSSNRI